MMNATTERLLATNLPLAKPAEFAALPDEVTGSIVLGSIACTALAALAWTLLRLARPAPAADMPM